MSKYKNKKTEVDGILFDSMKESTRYLYLKAQQIAGEIYELECQPVFKYMSDDNKKCLFKYIADFRYKYLTEGNDYDNDGNICSWYTNEIVEDVKSPMTAKLPVFRLKKKLIEDRFKIEINLV